MPGRRLSPQEIDQVLYEVKKEEAHTVRWPDAGDMLILAQAVKEKLPFVTLDGTRFTIRYVTHFGGACFIKPADTTSFVPCGYFSYKRLEGLLR